MIAYPTFPVDVHWFVAADESLHSILFAWPCIDESNLNAQHILSLMKTNQNGGILNVTN